MRLPFFKGKPKNWMIVLHKHHCGSCGYKSEILCDATENEAKGYAMIKAEEWGGGDIPKVTGMAFEIPDTVVVIHQRASE